MAISFKKAVKAESKLRLMLAGPSGAGKTYTALLLATTLAGDKPVAVIDTERGSASLYSDLFAFDVLELDTFHPDRYIEAVRAAEAAGYGAVVIDSLTHAWEGQGGLLEVVETIAKRSYGGNTFRAWAEGTPIYNRLVDTLTGVRLHVITTARTKNDYAMDKDERTGKVAPHKVGLAIKMRDGIEYEFDVVGKMTLDNEMIVEKSRCPALSGQVIRKPGPQVAETLAEWLRGVKPADLETRSTPAQTSAPVEVQEEWNAFRDTDVAKALRTLRFTQNSEQHDYLTALRQQFDEDGRAWSKDAVMAHLRAAWQQQREAEKRAQATPALDAVDMGAPGN